MTQLMHNVALVDKLAPHCPLAELPHRWALRYTHSTSQSMHLAHMHRVTLTRPAFLSPFTATFRSTAARLLAAGMAPKLVIIDGSVRGLKTWRASR